MKYLFIVLSACLFLISPANANQYNKDDRYFRSASLATDVIKAIRKKPNKYKDRHGYIVVAKKKPAYKRIIAPGQRAIEQIPAGVRFLADGAQAASEPFRAMGRAAAVLGGRPAGCPARAWCGCFLSKHMGLHRRDLWLARNWARLGTPVAPSPGAVVVFARGRGGHVGKITAVDGHRIKVLSGNDGRMVRERWRTMAGVIAVRRI